MNPFLGLRSNWPKLYIWPSPRSQCCLCYPLAEAIEIPKERCNCNLYAEHTRLSNCIVWINRSWISGYNNESYLHSSYEHNFLYFYTLFRLISLFFSKSCVAEIEKQLIDSNTKCIICTIETYAPVQEAINRTNKNIKIICIKTDAQQPLPDGTVDFFALTQTDGTCESY